MDFKPQGDYLDGSTVETLRSLGGDDAFVKEVMDAYIESSGALVADISGACASGDVDALSRAAHTLKGASLNVGALRVAEVARDMEAGARRGALAEASSLLEPLKAVYAPTLEALKAL